MTDVVATYTSPVVSADLQRIAVAKEDRTNQDIWIIDQARGTSSRFTFDPAAEDAPVWAPDGGRIVFASNRNDPFDLYQKSADGAGQEEALFKSDHPKIPDDWSADGRYVLYREQDPKTGWDLWVLPLAGDRPSTSSGRPEPAEGRKPQHVLNSPFNEIQGQFSPDGRWIAYVSNESGAQRVYVQSFPLSGGKWQISTGAAFQPRWRRDGKELFFLAGTGTSGLPHDVTVVAVDTSGAVFKFGVPQKLFTVTPERMASPRNTWDVTPDGQRFLVNSPTQIGAPPWTVVLNWLQGQTKGSRWPLPSPRVRALCQNRQSVDRKHWSDQRIEPFLELADRAAAATTRLLQHLLRSDAPRPGRR